MNQEAYRTQVAARAQEIIAHKAGQANHSLWDAHVLLATGADEDRLVEVVEKGLAKRTEGPNSRRTGGPFQVFPCMALLCRWPEQLPAAARAVIKEFMTAGVLERGNTENHWLMYYAGNLLAAETWPDLERTWNGQSPAAVRAEASRWILGMIQRTAKNGHHEYDSPQYHIEHMVPMIVLADRAQDPHLRRQARQVLSLYTADMALEYFDGAWAGGHSREGYRENTWRRSGAIGILQYLYFGGEAFDPRYHAHGFGIPAVVAAYCPPALFAAMAFDRAEPHVIKKTKAPRTIYRCVDRAPQPVRKYTYMSPSFALGTTQTGLPGPSAGPIDLISWDLTLKGGDQQCKITCNHPYRSPDRFSAFLINYPQSIGRAISSDKPYLQWSDRLFGASPYEQIMQHEGAAALLYRIPPEDEAPFVNIFLPKSIAWVERHGWLLGDSQTGAHIALRPIGDYQWLEIREAGAVRFMVTDANQIDGWLLRLAGPYPGLLVEAAEADTTFDDFCQHRAQAPLDLSGWPDQQRIGFETLAGRRLEMTYDGLHLVDGQALDYQSYPLYEGPGIDAPLGSGKMTFSRGDQKVHLDFGIDPDGPLIPMRVIG